MSEDQEPERPDPPPTPKLKDAKLGALLGFVVLGLAADVAVYSALNMVSFIGGPFALMFCCARTLSLGGLAQIGARRFGERAWLQWPGILLIWCATVVPLIALGDQATVAFYRSDTERVARLYGQGALPPGCLVGLPFRAHPETDLECRGSVASVAAFYRSRLAPGWVETRPPGHIKFEKSPDEFVIVFERTGTKVVVSPTAW